MKICLVGADYVGLVSAAFANLSWEVICVDKDEARTAPTATGTKTRER